MKTNCWNWRMELRTFDTHHSSELHWRHVQASRSARSTDMISCTTTMETNLWMAIGYYLSTDEVVPIGDILADFTGGVYTDLAYKNCLVQRLVDFQKGGSVHSYSNQWGKYSGTLAETAEDDIRENGVVVEGMVAEQNSDGDWISTGNENTTTIGAQSHFFYNQGLHHPRCGPVRREFCQTS